MTHIPRLALALVAPSSASAVAAADMLPLTQGIYVPQGVACRGASNADMVNYWGGSSGIGVAQASCTITRLSKSGQRYTLHDRCTDNQSGDVIEGGPTRLVISGPRAFTMNGKAYRYCGPRPIW